MNLCFIIEVEVTNRERNADGSYSTEAFIVEVSANTETEACLIAAQMVAATNEEGMVLGTKVTDVIA